MIEQNEEEDQLSALLARISSNLNNNETKIIEINPNSSIINTNNQEPLSKEYKTFEGEIIVLNDDYKPNIRRSESEDETKQIEIVNKYKIGARYYWSI